MKKLIVISTVLAVVFSSCGTGGRSVKTDVDSVSYAIGVTLGNQIVSSGDSILNPNLIAKGIIDVFNKKGDMNSDSAMVVINEYYTVKVPAKKLKEQETYLQSVEAGNANIQKTESGLMYEILEQGDTEIKAVNDADQVKVKYTGRFKEGDKYDADKLGEEFDSSGDSEVDFPLNRVIPGWTEGMKLVGKGGKIRLWIPAELAYGTRGTRNIGPNEPLVFDVEIVDVIPAEVEAVVAAE